jgi:hypothetical protein
VWAGCVLALAGVGPPPPYCCPYPCPYCTLLGPHPPLPFPLRVPYRCQQRECTVGIWVGATVGRGGGVATSARPRVALHPPAAAVPPTRPLPYPPAAAAPVTARPAARVTPSMAQTARPARGTGGPARLLARRSRGRCHAPPPSRPHPHVLLTSASSWARRTPSRAGAYGVRDAACPISTG